MVVLVPLATLIASGVEWVEALTIVLAVGIFKNWRSALAGAAGAFIGLGLLVAILGPAITAYGGVARTVVGIFLLLFGLRWLHRAILRSSGLKSLHDEAKAFAETREFLESHGEKANRLDWVGVTTAFNGVFLEGLEVVFIVIALGGLHNLGLAASGALASLVLVAGAGVLLREPLTRVPENTLKYMVGIMLTSFGTFFAGEGIGVHWWNEDLSLLPLIALYLLASLALVQLLKNPPGVAVEEIRVAGVLRSAVLEVWGLFVDDGALAVVAVAVVLAVSVFVDHFSGRRDLASFLLVAGVLVAILVSVAGAARGRAHLPAAEVEAISPSLAEEHFTEPTAVR